jgi:hypothetical protein
MRGRLVRSFEALGQQFGYAAKVISLTNYCLCIWELAEVELSVRR